MRSSLRCTILLFALLLLPAIAAGQTIIYVDGSNASGTEDGDSWSTAYMSLHDAIADPDATGSSASNTEIWIAEGVYTPTDDGDIANTNRDPSFTITGNQDGLEIYGGFESGDAFSDRSPSEHPVVLSGDIDDNDNNKTAYGVTPAASDIVGGNSYHVLVLNAGTAIGPNVSDNVTGATVLDGLTVTGGSADGSSPNDRGGGLFCDGQSTGNECSPTIRRVAFSGNKAGAGGAIFNAAGPDGKSSPTIDNAIFSGNTGSLGGAIHNAGNQSGTTNPSIRGTVFSNNSADGGGAIYNNGSSGSSHATIINSTFSQNSAQDGGAILTVGTSSSSNPVIKNTILWGNKASNSGDEVYNVSASPTFLHSIVQGSGGSSAWDSGVGTDGGGNLDADPKFFTASNPDGLDNRFATSDDGLRLVDTSPALDTGDNNFVPSGVTTDLTGAPRIQNGTVDLGAYEGGVARVLHVDAATGADGNTGTSWSSPFATLTKALAVATGNDEIWIAEGAYTPTDAAGIASSNRGASFTITGNQDGLEIYGGFENGDAFPDRSPSEHPVVLSGDIDNNDNNKTADGVTPTASDIAGSNSYHVLVFDGGNRIGADVTANITRATVLSGVTVTAGNADGNSSDNLGGGLFCDGGSSGNKCSLTIKDAAFSGNNAGGGTGSGGAILNAGNDGTSSPLIVRTTFRGNSADGNGGAVYNYAQGGKSNPTITNSVFTNNSASSGGAIYNDGFDGTSSPSITNSIFSGNSAGTNGGVMYNNGNYGTSSPVATNVSYVGNAADGNGGAIYNDGYGGTCSPTFRNAIFWGNTADADGDGVGSGNEVFIFVNASPTYSHSLIQGSGGSGSGWDSNLGIDDGGNLDVDPQFVDAGNPDGIDNRISTADDGLRLTKNSPALDVGDNGAVPSSVTTDVTGAPRIQDGTVDLGAYEGGVDQAQTYYVDGAAGDDTNAGTSWSGAFATLTKALSIATGNDEIWIAEGMYTPTDAAGISASNRNTSFTITGNQDGLEIYGGFKNGDAFPDRSPSEHPVVLSGDIDDNDNNKTADGVTPTASDIAGSNSYHVLVFNGGETIGANITANVSDATVLDGVTVTGGNADGSSPNDCGGGLFCDGQSTGNECSPTIRRVAFSGNNAAFGGAAMYNDGYSGTSSPTITNTTFSGNSAGSTGGALYNSSGNSGTSSPVITNATFSGNSASFNGGAIYNNGDTGTSSPVITNSTFSGNNAGSVGGALVSVAGSGGTANPIVSNSILWGNSASNSGDEIYNSSATPSFAHSIVQGSGGSNSWDSNLGTDDGGNLDADPQFVDASGPDGTPGTADDDLRVQGPGSGGGASPAIDAGDNSALPSGISTGLFGNPRLNDVSSVSNTGDGTPPVDIGAHESTGSPLPVELASLEARTTGEGTVRLSWQTASETGNAGFDIQRRIAETRRGASQHSKWKTIGRVDGAGTTSEAQHYQFTDRNLPYGADTLQYRLKQVDVNGSTSLSDPVIVARGAVDEVTLRGPAPNPARNQAVVRFALPEGTDVEDVQLRVYDVLGRRVQTIQTDARAGRHRLSLDLSDKASGMYYLQLRAGNRVRTTKLTVRK